MSEALIKKLGNTLSTLQGTIDTDVPIFRVGIDSLLEVELRKWIGKEFGSDMATFEILDFVGLGNLIAKRSSVKHPG